MQNPTDSRSRLPAGLSIPPRPALLMALQREMRKEDPDFTRIGRLLRRDAGLAGSVLKTANSAFYGTNRRVQTIEDAIILVGMSQFTALMMGLITRQVLANGAMMMARFWDVSEKRSAGMGLLAKQIRMIAPEKAYTFGLFCDIGIPLLKAHFPDYLETLMMANHGTERFTQVEDERHNVNHTIAGAVLAESWGIDPHVVMAIRLHHTHEILHDDFVAQEVRRLVAANLIVERAIQEFRGDTAGYSEWQDAGETANAVLGLTTDASDALCTDLKDMFSAPIA